MNTRKNLFNESIIYVVSGFIISGIIFLTTPVLTRMLSPEEFGITSMYLTMVIILSTMMGAVGGAIPNAKIEYGEEKIDSFISSSIALILIIYFALLAVCLALNDIIYKVIGIPSDFVWIMVTHALFMAVVNMWRTYTVQLRKPIQNFVLSLVIAMSTFVFTVAFIQLSEGSELAGSIYGAAIGYVVVGVIALVFFIKKGKKLISTEYWKFNIGISLPLVAHVLSAMIISQMGKIMVNYFCGSIEAGIYTVALTISSIATVFWAATNKAWIPWYFEKTKINSVKSVNSVAKNYIMLYSLAISILLLIGPEIMKLFSTESYWSGISVLPVLVLGLYFRFLYSFPSNYEFYKKKTKWIAIGTAISAIVGFILNIILIPQFGIMGAAVSTLASMIFLFVLHEFIARNVVKGFNIRFSNYILGTIVVLTSFACTLVFEGNALIRITMSFILFVVVLIYLWKMKNNRVINA